MLYRSELKTGWYKEIEKEAGIMSRYSAYGKYVAKKIQV